MYIIYKTTNLINGKYYIGKHRINGDIDDGYLGSGELILKAIAKHGPENFVRETLETFDDEKECMLAEAKYVNHEDPNSYNLVPGGYGGPAKRAPWNKGKKMSAEYCEANRQGQLKRTSYHVWTEEEKKEKLCKPKRKGHAENVRKARLGKSISQEVRDKISASLKGRPGNRKGAKLSEETKRKISESRKRMKARVV